MNTLFTRVLQFVGLERFVSEPAPAPVVVQRKHDSGGSVPSDEITAALQKLGRLYGKSTPPASSCTIKTHSRLSVDGGIVGLLLVEQGNKRKQHLVVLYHHDRYALTEGVILLAGGKPTAVQIGQYVLVTTGVNPTKINTFNMLREHIKGLVRLQGGRNSFGRMGGTLYLTEITTPVRGGHTQRLAEVFRA